MEFKVKGRWVSVDASEQPDDLLRRADEEITTTALERGIVLPGRAGRVAIVGSFSDVPTFPPSFGNAEEDPEASADIPAFEPITKESFLENFNTTIQGYKTMVESINSGNKWKTQRNKVARVSPEQLMGEFESWWSSSNKQESIAAAQESDPGVRFTLVATPNVPLTDKQLVATVKKFASTLGVVADTDDLPYFRLTSSQVLGTFLRGDASVIFSLMPSRYTVGMNGTVLEQRAKMSELRRDASNYDLEVPGPQEAVTYWHTLQAQGVDLAGDAIHDLTFINHFNLRQNFADGHVAVRTYIDCFGGLHITGGFTNNVIPARLAIR